MGYCIWADMIEANRSYHDTEWGIPVHDDRHMFEHLILECMQCGLSWDLMLKKREIFRSCFAGFDYDRIAAFTDEDVDRIMNMDGQPRGSGSYRSLMKLRMKFQKNISCTIKE